MLTLDLTPNEMKQLEQASKQAGMTVSQYVLSKLFAEPLTNSTNPMIQKSLSINNPSVLSDGMSIQQELRHEWD